MTVNELECPRCSSVPISLKCFTGDCAEGTLDMFPRPTLESVGQNEEDFLAALADRPEIQTHWGSEICGATGPGGECCRAPGHTDRKYPYSHNNHYSFDTDYYTSWPVGWKDESDWLEDADKVLKGLLDSDVITDTKLKELAVKIINRPT